MVLVATSNCVQTTVPFWLICDSWLSDAQPVMKTVKALIVAVIHLFGTYADAHTLI